MANTARQLTDEDIIRAVNKLDERTVNVGKTQVEHGLLLEFAMMKLSTAVDAEGNSIFPMNLEEEFSAFAQERMAEIRKDIENAREIAVAQQAKVNLND